MNLWKVCLKVLLGGPVILLALFGVLAILYLFACGYFRGPVSVQSCASPDGKHVAYVLDFPEFDPPNQRAFVGCSEYKGHVMDITAFAADQDFIKRIAWSPDSLIVIFHSKDYLTITRVSDWFTVKVSLAREWKGAEAHDHEVNPWGGPNREVDRIQFPRPGVIAYYVAGEASPCEINLNVLLRTETISQQLTTRDIQ